MPRLLDLDRLQTVHNYAKAHVSASGKVGVTVGYVYRLIEKGKLPNVTIDGMLFVILPNPPASSPTEQEGRGPGPG